MHPWELMGQKKTDGNDIMIFVKKLGFLKFKLEKNCEGSLQVLSTCYAHQNPAAGSFPLQSFPVSCCTPAFSREKKRKLKLTVSQLHLAIKTALHCEVLHSIRNDCLQNCCVIVLVPNPSVGKLWVLMSVLTSVYIHKLGICAIIHV